MMSTLSLSCYYKFLLLILNSSAFAEMFGCHQPFNSKRDVANIGGYTAIHVDSKSLELHCIQMNQKRNAR